MTSNERLSHILVAIPIAHILGSAFYLYSYCLGFGANIVVYASASDLVSVSINDMVPVYTVSLIFPLVLAVGRLSSPQPYAVDKVKALPVDQQDRGYADNLKFRRRVMSAAVIGFILCAGLTLWNLWKGNQLPYHLVWIVLIITETILWMKFCEKREYGNWTFEAGEILGGFVTALFCIGAAHGQTDRFIPYKLAKTANTACSNAVILRQLSGNFLAIMPDNTRAFVGDDCKAKFTVPAPRGNSPYQTPRAVKQNKPTVRASHTEGSPKSPTAKN